MQMTSGIIMESCFVPSEWREVKKDGHGNLLCFLHLEKLKDCLSDSVKGYTVPCSTLWSGVPNITPEQVLQPGRDINKQSHRHEQITCFTELAKSYQEEPCPPDALVDLTKDVGDECGLEEECMIIDEEQHTPISTVHEIPPEKRRNQFNDVTTGDSGYCGSVGTESPVSICDSSVENVEETEDERCLVKSRESPLPGLSLLYQKISQLCKKSAILDPQPSVMSSPGPIVPTERAKTLMSSAHLGSISKAAPSANKSKCSVEVVDLTLDDDVVDVVSVKKEGGALVSTNHVPVVTCCGISLTRADLDTLRPNCWLNDQVINAFMKLLMKSYNSLPNAKGSVTVHIVSTFFYTKLRSSGFSGVQRWLKSVDMFRLRLLLVPVHLGFHWCLAAINFRNKSISYFDSMGGKNVACLKTLKMFLMRCGLMKRARLVRCWRLCHPQGVPRQNNSSDCGVFVCQFARWLCSTGMKPHSNSHFKIPFSHKHMPQFRTLIVQQLKQENLYPNF